MGRIGCVCQWVGYVGYVNGKARLVMSMGRIGWVCQWVG